MGERGGTATPITEWRTKRRNSGECFGTTTLAMKPTFRPFFITMVAPKLFILDHDHSVFAMSFNQVLL